MRALRRLLLPLAAQSLVLLGASGTSAAKGNAGACSAADDSAVELMSQQKLGDARAQLKICSAQACPASVRKECQGLAAQVEAAMPSIVFSAADSSGAELHAVKVTMDGRPLAESLDGTAFDVDPGEHSFSFATEGQPAISRSFTLVRGQKRRRETIAFASATEAPPLAPESPTPAAQPASSASNVGMITGGLGFAGVTGIALGGLFGLLTISARNQETSDCASPTRCTNHGQAVSDRSTAFADGTISTVGFVAGGVLLAGAAVYYFVIGRPSAEPAPAATGLLLAPSIGPGAGGIWLKGDF